MSQSAPAADKSAARRAKKSLVPPDERFWQRYSPHAELPLSGATSLALHLLLIGLMLLAAWLAYSVFRHSSRSLPIEAVRLGGGGGNPHGEGGGPNQGKQPEEVANGKTDEGTTNPDPAETDKPVDLKVQPATPEETKYESLERLIQQSNTASSQAMQRLAKQKIYISLPDSGRGKGGKGQGGGSGQGQGTGIGDGRGEGTSGNLNQRVKRMLRWSMLFDTRSGRDYLAQLQGLGAILAIPVDSDANAADAPEKKYKIIRDLSARPVELVNEDVRKLNRIYWVDDNPQSVRDVMTFLGVRLQPRYFVAFMPQELEQKLFELERDYLGQRYPGRTENDIEVTKFKINRTGKNCQPEVVNVELKKAK